MTGFNYLRSRRAVRLPQHLQIPFAFLCAAVMTVSGTWAFERHRLHDALAIEVQYRAEYDASAARLKRENVYYRDVLSLLALDARVRAIQSSGFNNALNMSRVANALPAGAFVRSIVRDQAGLALEGRAQDMDTIADVLRGLQSARGLRNPVLREAALASDRPGDRGIKYEVHIETHA